VTNNVDAFLPRSGIHVDGLNLLVRLTAAT